MKRMSLAASMLLILLAAPGGDAAGALVWRLGSVVPANSLWDKILKEMAAGIARATERRLELRIISSDGDEGAIIRKMQFANQRQAAALTAIGLADIDPAFSVFGIPLFFESYDELYYVQDKLTPMLKARLEAKDLALLHWGSAGWVQVFSKRPARTLADLKGLKIFTSAGDDRMVQWYKATAFSRCPWRSPTRPRPCRRA